jgi:CDP-glucose 4,6-dehydratase
MASLAEDLRRFSGRRVLITGHTGFKGSWLSYLLMRAGANVTGIALDPQTKPSHYELLKLAENIDSRRCDIRDLTSLKREFSESRPEVVFHLAAQAFVRTSYRDPHTTFTTNVLGSTNLLECVNTTESVRTLVYITSDKCYRNKEQRHGYVESDELGGIDPYSLSKAAAEMVFRGYVASSFARPDAPKVASARAGNVVGGGDWSPDRLVPDCIRALTAGQAIEIRHPRATRPWQHVLEPLSGYLRLAVALEDGVAPTGEAWNFGPSENSIHEVSQVAALIARHWSRPDSVKIGSDSSNMHESQLLQLNSSKARRVLDWSTRWDFHTTITRTSDWYRSVGDGIPATQITADDVETYLAEHD